MNNEHMSTPDVPDLAEERMIEAMHSDNEHEQVEALQTYLLRYGQHRGYTIAREIEIINTQDDD